MERYEIRENPGADPNHSHRFGIWDTQRERWQEPPLPIMTTKGAEHELKRLNDRLHALPLAIVREIQQPGVRPLDMNVGRCERCRRAYLWKRKSQRRIASVRCPVCSVSLRPTTVRYSRGRWYLAEL